MTEDKQYTQAALAAARQWLTRVIVATVVLPFVFNTILLTTVGGASSVEKMGGLFLIPVLAAVPGLAAALIVRSRIITKWPDIRSTRAKTIAGLIGFLIPYAYNGLTVVGEMLSPGGFDSG